VFAFANNLICNQRLAIALLAHSSRTRAGVVDVPGVTSINVGDGAAAQLLGAFKLSLKAPVGLIRKPKSAAVKLLADNPATSNTKPLIPRDVLIKFEYDSVWAVAPDLAITFEVSSAAWTLWPANDEPR
jgi:hypothetical protein